MANLNTGTSIVDALKGAGQDSSYSARANLAVKYGVVKSATDYIGSAEQNTSLLTKFNSGVSATPASVTNKNDAAAFINANQDGDIAAATKTEAPPVRNVSQDLADAFKGLTGKTSIVPSTPAPAAPNFEQTYIDLRKQYGVDGLESSLNDLQTEADAIHAQFRVQRDAETGKPVALNVIEGRISEEEKQANERLDVINSSINTATRQLTAANTTIENIINFRKMDYDVAKSTYDSEFSQNMQLFDLIKGVYDTQLTENDRAQDTARSNLQIIYNSIQDGNTKIEALDAPTKAKIQGMELQAGLPVGFFANIQADKPNAKVLSTTTRTTGGVKYADVLYQNPDGSLTTQSVRLGSASSGTTPSSYAPAVSFEEYLAAAEQELQANLDPNGQTYKDLQAQWKKDYPATTSLGFTDTELKKLEQAGLLSASRQDQLDYLYGGDSGDNPFQ